MKKIIILLMFVLCLVSFVLAETPNNYNATIFIPFNDSTGVVAKGFGLDTRGLVLNGTNTVWVNASFNGQSIVGVRWGNQSGVNISNKTSATNLGFTGATNWSVWIRVNLTSYTGNGGICPIDNVGSNTLCLVYRNNIWNWRVTNSTGASNDYPIVGNLSLNRIVDVAITSDVNNMTLYVNGTVVSTNASIYNLASGGFIDLTTLHDGIDDGWVVNATVYGLGMWNNTKLTSAQIASLSVSSSITNIVTINAPTNNSAFFVGNHNYFDVNVSSSGFGGNVTTQLNIYNSTNDLLFTYFSQSNPYVFNITNLSVGTYTINATAWNYSNYDFQNHIYVNRTGLYNMLRQNNQTGNTFSNFTGSGNAQLLNSSNINDLWFNTSNQTFTYMVWMSTQKPNISLTGTNTNYAVLGRGFQQGVVIQGTNIFIFLRNTTSGTMISTYNYNPNNEIFMITGVFNGTHTLIYNGSTLMDSDLNTIIEGQRLTSSGNDFRIMGSMTSAGNTNLSTRNDTLYLVKIWNRSLSASEIATEYNLGYSNLTSNTNALLLQQLFNNSASVYSNSSTVFNVNLTSQKIGGFENTSTTTTAYIYNSSSGSILTPVVGFNSSSRYLNISWSNATFNPVFVSVTNTTLYLLNSDSSINRTIYNFTNAISINNYTYDLYSQNLSVGSYYVRLDQVDINGNGRTTSNRINITTNTLLNITAKTISGAAIQNFSINAYNSLYAYNKTSNTTNAYLEIDHIRGNISLIIDAQGYSTNFSTANIQVNTANYSYQFTLYETNTFNITFYNQATPTVLLTGINISLDLISNLYAQNYTTNNGTLYIPLLVPETYTIRYYSNGFTTRFYYFTLNNRSYEEIKLYLINSSSSYNFTVYVVNQVLNPVEGAIVKNLKYDLATNSYLVQEIGTTDVAGKTTFTVTYNNEYYKQIVEYPSGTFKKMTTPDYIDTPSVVIPISLGDNNIVEEVVNYDGINGILVFNNVTNNFRFDWSDTSLVASEYCLDVYRMTGLAKTLYNNTCEAGASAGTILLGVANGSGYVYYAEATYFENSIEKFLTSLYYEYQTPDADEPLGNKYGLFIQLILTMGVTSLVVLNIGLAMILAPFSLIIGKILGWNVFTWAGLFALQVVGIILAIISSMRR